MDHSSSIYRWTDPAQGHWFEPSRYPFRGDGRETDVSLEYDSLGGLDLGAGGVQNVPAGFQTERRPGQVRFSEYRKHTLLPEYLDQPCRDGRHLGKGRHHHSILPVSRHRLDLPLLECVTGDFNSWIERNNDGLPQIGGPA